MRRAIIGHTKRDGTTLRGLSDLDGALLNNLGWRWSRSSDAYRLHGSRHRTTGTGDPRVARTESRLARDGVEVEVIVDDDRVVQRIVNPAAGSDTERGRPGGLRRRALLAAVRTTRWIGSAGLDRGQSGPFDDDPADVVNIWELDPQWASRLADIETRRRSAARIEGEECAGTAAVVAPRIWNLACQSRQATQLQAEAADVAGRLESALGRVAIDACLVELVHAQIDEAHAALRQFRLAFNAAIGTRLTFAHRARQLRTERINQPPPSPIGYDDKER